MNIKKIYKLIINKNGYRCCYTSDLRTKWSLLFLQDIFIGQRNKFNQRVVFLNKGKIVFGEKARFGYYRGGGYHGKFTEIQVRSKEGEIIVGDNFFANNGLFMCCLKKIVIGDDVLIGSNVSIMDHNGHGISPQMRHSSSGTAREVTIGNNVWLGSNCFILPGSIIGDNSVVGAGAIVKGNFPKNSIITGNPAVVVRKITENFKNRNIQ